MERASSQLVSVVWTLFNPVNPKNAVNVINIPLQQYMSESRGCRQLFVTPLFKTFRFLARANRITFWQPNQDLSLFTVPEPGWTETISRFSDNFTMIPLSCSFKTALERTIHKRGVVHLVVTAEDSHTWTPMVRELVEGWNNRCGLPWVRRYLQTLTTKERRSSVAGKSTEHPKTQVMPNKVTHNGLPSTSGSVDTRTSPIAIFHPVFDQFVRDANNTQIKPSREFLIRVQDFMLPSFTIQRMERIVDPEVVEKIFMTLGYCPLQVGGELGVDMSWPSEAFTLEAGTCGVRCPLLIMDQGGTIDKGGDDLLNQARDTIQYIWLQDNRARVRNQCCCPTFTLMLAGPWLCVLGAVFTDRIIAEYLTDMMWIGLSSTNEKARVHHLARVLSALRRSLDNLKAFYGKLPIRDNPLFNPQLHYQRFFPYPRFFLENGQKIYFNYSIPLQEYEGCVTFLAKVQGGACPQPEVVVKFVDEYGKDVHEFLAAKGHAPRLRYYGRPPGEGDALGDDGILHPTETPSGPALGPSKVMVVMDFIESQEGPVPEDAREQVRQVLVALHQNGFVFGDLREQNILFDSDGKVKLVDFDFSGRYDTTVQDRNLPDDLQACITPKGGVVQQAENVDFVRYPLGLSGKVFWPAGVGDLVPIRPRHDWAMFEKLWKEGK